MAASALDVEHYSTHGAAAGSPDSPAAPGHAGMALDLATTILDHNRKKAFRRHPPGCSYQNTNSFVHRARAHGLLSYKTTMRSALIALAVAAVAEAFAPVCPTAVSR